MWIFDSYYKGYVELWGRERGLNKASAAYPPSFYMHMKAPSVYQKLFKVLAGARGREELHRIEPKA